jgi:hypothetical protein
VELLTLLTSAPHLGLQQIAEGFVAFRKPGSLPPASSSSMQSASCSSVLLDRVWSSFRRYGVHTRRKVCTGAPHVKRYAHWRHSCCSFLQAIENRCIEELLTACRHDEKIELASPLVLE